MEKAFTLHEQSLILSLLSPKDRFLQPCTLPPNFIGVSIFLHLSPLNLPLKLLFSLQPHQSLESGFILICIYLNLVEIVMSLDLRASFLKYHKNSVILFSNFFSFSHDLSHKYDTKVEVDFRSKGIWRQLPSYKL